MAIAQRLQAARAEAFDRVPLFRLAWDASISAFAGRQVLYERFFFGDPVRMAGALVTGHGAQIQEYAEKVRAFVKEGRDDARLAYGAEPRFWVEPERREEFSQVSDARRCAWAWRRYVEAVRSAGASGTSI